MFHMDFKLWHSLAATSISCRTPNVQPSLYHALCCISLHPHPLAFWAEVTAGFLHFHESIELFPRTHALHTHAPLCGLYTPGVSLLLHKLVFSFLLNQKLSLWPLLWFLLSANFTFLMWFLHSCLFCPPGPPTRARFKCWVFISRSLYFQVYHSVWHMLGSQFTWVLWINKHIPVWGYGSQGLNISLPTYFIITAPLTSGLNSVMKICIYQV